MRASRTTTPNQRSIPFHTFPNAHPPSELPPPPTPRLTFLPTMPASPNLILPNIPQQPNLPRPLLPHNRPNLLRRQHKPNTARSVRGAQFHRPRMVRAAHSVMMVARVTGREIQNLTTRSRQILAATRAGRFNCSRCSGCDFEHAVDRFRERIAGEAPGSEDELAVGVEVDEGADAGASGVRGGGVAGRGGEFDGQAVYGLVLGRVAWGFTTVGLAAGVWSRAALGGFGVPFEDPVAVAVGSEAGCVDVWARLAVFAPEAVAGLGVEEAWGVSGLIGGRHRGVFLGESWD